MAAPDTGLAATHRRVRRDRANVSSYDALVSTPHDFGSLNQGETTLSPLLLPAGARLWLEADVDLAAGAVEVHGTNPTDLVVIPELFTGQRLDLGYYGHSQTLSIKNVTGPAGLVSILLGRYELKAFATMTMTGA